MTIFLLILLGALCAFLLGWGLWKPGRMCAFPFLAGATFAGFVLPQAIGITVGEGHPARGTNDALLMSILCAGMCYVGWIISDAPAESLHWDLDADRLLGAGAVLSGIGVFFYVLIARLPPEILETGGWTGLPVAYYFFAQVLRYGFAIAVLLFAQTRSRWALALAAADSVILVYMIVIRARRGIAIEFFLVILCAFWFACRKTLPRWAMLLMVGTGVIGVAGTAAYRSTMYQDQAYGGMLRHEVPWEDLARIDFVDVFLTYNQEEAHEFRNLVYLMSVTDEFDLGLSYWNDFVFTFVPAQAVGAELKDGLRFDLPGEVTDPLSPGGTTITGMGDAFQAFGWFGCLVFFAMAFVLRRVFESAQAGQVAAQLIYMVVIASVLHTITHHTKWFVTGWVHMAVFLLPCLWWARKSVPSVARSGGPSSWQSPWRTGIPRKL